MTTDFFDVLVVGAGVSGIGVACRLARECPGKTYAILDRRQRLGGTKRSGNGREWGAAGIEEFLETKALMGAGA